MPSLTVSLAQRNKGWYWGSTKCSILIGFGHLFFGTTLLIYDVSTNHITDSTFAVSSSLCFIICAILLFISARKMGLDRAAHYLIIIFSVLSGLVGLCLIGGIALHINEICVAVKTVKCTFGAVLIHVFVVLIVLVEGRSNIVFTWRLIDFFSYPLRFGCLWQL